MVISREYIERPLLSLLRSQITDKWSVEAIETDHTVKSLGYLVYRTYPNSGAYAEVAYLGEFYCCCFFSSE